MARRQSSSAFYKQVLARFFGCMLALVIFVIMILIGLQVASSNVETSAKTPAQTEKSTQIAATENTPAVPVKQPKYTFYEQLSRRSSEVREEVAAKALKREQAVAEVVTYYRVQVGSFNQKELAEALRARLILRDLPVVMNKNGDKYLVQVGPFVKKEEAEKYQTQLKRDGFQPFLKTYVNK